MAARKSRTLVFQSIRRSIARIAIRLRQVLAVHVEFGRFDLYGYPTQAGLNAQYRVSPENYCSAIIVKMQRCPSCAHSLDSPPNDVLESFLCPYCGKQLKVALRYRTTILAVGAIAAVFMQAAKLAVSPKINMEKTSRLPFVLEGGLTHLFWRTKLVRVSPSPETSR